MKVIDRKRYDVKRNGTGWSVFDRRDGLLWCLPSCAHRRANARELSQRICEEMRVQSLLGQLPFGPSA